MSTKAVIYARYSSHNQTEQSIEGQLHDGHQYADQHEYVVISEYIDRALTGTKDERPAFQRMIKDAEKKQFEVIIVWKLDRFARNRYDSAIYKAKLKKYGVRVVSVKEAITDGPEGIILEGLLESMAEYYSANLAQNVKRGMHETAAKGLYCGGKVPFGYRVVDQRLVPDEKKAPIMKYVFEEFANGRIMQSILDELNDRGIRNSRGGLLTQTTFASALKSPIYYGTYTYGGQEVEGAVDPLISKETFDKVQARINKHKHAPAAAKAKEPYYLQSKIFCGLCGGPMFGESGVSASGKTFRYYNCRNRKRGHTCTKAIEKKSVLEDYVLREAIEYILKPAILEIIAEGVVKEYEKDFSQPQIDEIKKALSRIDSEMERLIDAMISVPKTAQGKIVTRMNELEAQKSAFEIDLAKLEIAAGVRITKEEVKAWLMTFRHGSISDPNFCHLIADTFVNAVYVYDDKIVIFYNISSRQSSTAKKEAIPDCSDMAGCGGAQGDKSEQIPYAYFFLHGLVGLVIFRK